MLALVGLAVSMDLPPGGGAVSMAVSSDGTTAGRVQVEPEDLLLNRTAAASLLEKANSRAARERSREFEWETEALLPWWLCAEDWQSGGGLLHGLPPDLKACFKQNLMAVQTAKTSAAAWTAGDIGHVALDGEAEPIPAKVDKVKGSAVDVTLLDARKLAGNRPFVISDLPVASLTPVDNNMWNLAMHALALCPMDADTKSLVWSCGLKRKASRRDALVQTLTEAQRSGELKDDDLVQLLCSLRQQLAAPQQRHVEASKMATKAFEAEGDIFDKYGVTRELMASMQFDMVPLKIFAVARMLKPPKSEVCSAKDRSPQAGGDRPVQAIALGHTKVGTFQEEKDAKTKAVAAAHAAEVEAEALRKKGGKVVDVPEEKALAAAAALALLLA